MLKPTPGAPGAGKGTLCKCFVDDPSNLYDDISHISIGDYLRRKKLEGTLPEDVEEAIEQQRLMTWEQLAPMLEAKIADECRQGRSVILLDGFPRNEEQMMGFKEVSRREIPPASSANRHGARSTRLIWPSSSTAQRPLLSSATSFARIRCEVPTVQKSSSVGLRSLRRIIPL